MANFFYILVAPSAVGKSDLLRKMEKEGRWNSIAKYSTRDVRYKNDEKDDVVSIDKETYNGLSDEDKSALRLKRIERIKDICAKEQGVVYYKNGNLYGIKIADVIEGLKKGNVVAIISDFKSIRSLKEREELKNRVKTLYIASTIDERVLLKRFKEREEKTKFNTNSEEKQLAVKKISAFSSILGSAVRLDYMERIEKVMPLLNEEWNAILPYFETIKNRGANISKLYYQYIENIALIDYPILNFYDLEYMYQQCRNIIDSNDKLEIPSQPCKKNPPVFMVCAAPSSGKKTLMEIIGDLGKINNNIEITTKYAQRNKRSTDGRDGMEAIGKDGKFEEYIEKKNIWKWSFHNGETSYAVDKSKIQENIGKGIAQIFISNMQQIDTGRKLFPDNLVVLYLHAAHETETRKHIEIKVRETIEKKIAKEKNCSEDEAKLIFKNKQYKDEFFKEVKNKENEVYEIHQMFKEHNNQIDHVLLNTGTREDLVNQMEKLIEYYKH